MSYKEEFASNNTDLQTILDKVNALPDAGSEYIEVTLMGTNSSAAFHYMDENNTKQTYSGTEAVVVKAYKGIVYVRSDDSPSATGDYVEIAEEFLTHECRVYVFLSDGGTVSDD